MHPATQYALDVISGKRLVGKFERLACLRHLNDLARAGQLDNAAAERISKITGTPPPARDADFFWMFDEAQATFVAIDWFRQLRHTEGRLVGQPIELCDAAVFDISCIFGWTSREPHPALRRADGRQVGVRRFRKAIKFVARKNAKTTEGSGIQLYGMVGDKESNPQCYCAAVDRGQAREMYNKARLMAENSPLLSKRLKIRDYKISHKQRGGSLIAVSKDTRNKDGLNPSFVYIDEYHAHPTSEIYDLFSSAKGQRLQPLMITITTAGNDVESPCYHELEYCRQIVSGQVENDRYFVMIRELDPDDDEHDPQVWTKANPLLCSTPEGLQELREMHDEAFDSRIPEKIRTFRVKNLNRWVHGKKDTYMGDYLEEWNQCAVSREEFRRVTNGLLTVAGVDLSKRIDLTADGFLFAVPNGTEVTLKDGRTVTLPDDSVAVCAHGFMPEESVKQHERTDRVPYRDWERDGWLSITPGNVVDYRETQAHIQEMEMAGNKIHEIAYDSYNATHFATEMQDEMGYTLVEVPQNKKHLSEPTKLFRELVLQGRLIHDGNPLLTWCIGNAVQHNDGNDNIKLMKQNKDDPRRIDLLAALITALTRLQPLQDATAGLPDDWGM